MGMTQEDYNNFKQLEKEIIDTLNLAMDEGDPKGKLAMNIVNFYIFYNLWSNVYNVYVII